MGFAFSISLSDLKGGFQNKRTQLVDFSAPRSLGAVRTYLGRWIDPKLLPNSGVVKMRLNFAADARFGPSLSRLEIEVSNLGTASFVRTTGLERRQHWRVYTSKLPRQ